ncbi:MAG: archaeosortase/exosortase family protein [Microcystis sp. M135S2]|uniref:archaeosortase/exosortase family protein n=1 Tax=Microcystis sp. M135S2 TaxID=2771144 RepID=UPI0025837B2A|nr:archaeosortase/exosortase family protein [Microcystis sp. M135S2]MCA2775343.1 archaeosortase/exosortase family protein [Microcystis sp. M135S2]
MELLLQQLKKIFYHRSFWIFVTLSCLAILHLYFVWRTSDKIPSLIDVLGWISIGFLLWKRKYSLKFRGSIAASIIGLALILWMLIRHILGQHYLSKVDVLYGCFPVITCIGLLLITSGFRKLITYKNALFIAALISLPYASLYNFLKPVITLDAQLLHFMLHYLGFQTTRKGAIVYLANGSVEVMPSCSSVGPILTMLPFIVVLLSIYPTRKSQKFFVYISSIFAIILINCLRLSLLAILLDRGDIDGFNYWHTGGGAGIFSNLIVFLIGGLSYKFLNKSYESNLQSISIKNKI